MPQTRQINSRLSPKLNNLESLPQPVVAFGRDYRKGEVLPFHQHQRAQFVYARQGLMAVNTRSASYLVPPQRAVWMPVQIEHQIEALSDLEMRTLYIDPAVLAPRMDDVRVLMVTPLVRELIITAVAEGPEYELDSPQSRIMSVILDQIKSLKTVSLVLPMPQDQRLLRITHALIADATDQRDISQWAREVGASKRTLNRLFNAETGMSFRDWRLQRRLHKSLELLSTGKSVTSIAYEVGYENPSAFIAMFKRSLGKTPANYFDQK